MSRLIGYIWHKLNKYDKRRGEVQLYLHHLTHGYITGGTKLMFVGYGNGDVERIIWQGEMKDLREFYYKNCKISKLKIERILSGWSDFKGLVIMFDGSSEEIKKLFRATAFKTGIELK